MIPQIKEVNFGPNTANDYATLHQATVNIATMGDRTITTQVRIDGDVVPDFTGWELEFRGERFILPTREPQARKDNTTKNSLIDLTFCSWPVYELKRYFFVEMSSTTSGTAIADKYDASLALNLENFVDAFNLVLDHYFNGRIQISLFGQGQGIYSTDPVFFEINYTKLWEVLQKVYEMYNVRWWFDYDSASGIYLIKMGYTADSIDDHDFSYGYKGGLLSFERTVQSDDLVNILLGRGGEKNLPYRYFKRTDPDNPGWTADPDAIPELANIYFDRLHDVNFRWYVRGWMTNPTPNRDRSWEQEGYVYPTYSISPDSPYYFAYQKGATDAKFNPVEFVKDDESIAAHGEVWGALDDNDDIYPTIQGVDIPNDSPDIGRVDESVAISQIETDDIGAYASAAAVETTIKDMKVSLSGNNVLTHTIYSEPFTIAQGETGNVTYRPFSKETAYPNFVYYDTTRSTLVAEPLSGGSDQSGTASYDESTGLYAVSGIPAGTYRLKLNLVLRVDSPATAATGTFGIENVVLTTSAANTNAWKPTFDIWVKNLWQTTQGTNESNKDYAERVWGPILGDRLGDEAKIVFSTGAMSISQDYEFVIADYPVPDRTKTLNGVPSEWKITVYKSDAEYQATGLYIPNASSTQPLAGDKFFFVGIDMPFQYVEWAEERLNQYKTDNLDGVSEISPTWTLKLDKVRINSLEDEDYGQKLADRLDAGVMIRTTDPRFTHGDILSLYIQSITWTWNEPSKGNPYIVPDVEVILADKISAVESPISRLENDVDVISQTYVQSGDVEAVVRRVAGALFLKKTGESDSSSSPTTFSSKVTSRNFRKGGIGGAGWGLYEDNSRKFSQSSPATRADVSDEEETVEPRTVLEVDRLVVREEMEVNNLVINQISARGGREIISAARIETTLVRETDTSYVCYFDQKQNSIANLFRVNDIAYGQVWSADNTELRFYKMLVTAVDVNSITLAKTGSYGSGFPQEGDVIVQYGNTTDPSRQYVIIRDVVGGGHDRMLSGLNSVSAEGVEYYYAGVETGDTPRWFVGDRQSEYAEYKNGQLNIKGRLSVLKSDGTYQSMAEFISQIADDEQSLQEQIDGLSYLKSATNSGVTLVDGGLILSNLMALGKTEEGTFNIYSGINGIMDANAYGNGIAAWYGGPMIDHEAAPGTTPYANSLFRFDGSGYLAGGLLKWGVNNGEAFLTLNGEAVVGGLGGTTLNDIANLMFEVVEYKTGHYAAKLKTRAYYGSSLVSLDGLYAEGWVSAGGVNDTGGGGGGGASYLRELLDVDDNIDSTSNYGKYLYYDGTLGKWTAKEASGTQVTEETVAGWGFTKNIGTVTQVKVGDTAYNPSNGVVSLPAYPTTLPASDVSAWAKKSSLDAVDVPSLAISKITGLQSALDAKAAASDLTVLQRYFTDGSAKSALRLAGSETRTAWGRTYWSSGVPASISGDMTGVGRITMTAQQSASSSGNVLEVVNVGTASAPVYALHSTLPIYSDSWVSAGGIGSSGDEGGASWLRELRDVDDNLNPHSGDALVYDGSKWTADTIDLTGFVTTSALNTALAGYATTSALATANAAISAAETDIDTLQGYFTGGVANSATRLQNSRTIWGQPFDGTNNVDGILSLSYASTDRATGIEVTSSNSGEASIGFASTNRTVFGRYADRGFVWGSVSGELMTFLDNGNVGVGMNAPAYKLDVNGDIRSGGRVYVGTSGGYLEVVNVAGEGETPVYALKSSLPFYSDSWVSAGGVSTAGSGGGGSSYLRDLLDVDVTTVSPVEGNALMWDSLTQKWVARDVTDYMSGYLPLAGGTMSGPISMPTGSSTNSGPILRFRHESDGSQVFDAYVGANNGGTLALYAANDIRLRPGNSSSHGLIITTTDITYNGVSLKPKFFYGTSSSSGTARSVTASGFTSANLTAGTVLVVQMTNSLDTSSNVTINVNSTGNKYIYAAGGYKSWKAGENIILVYTSSSDWAILPTYEYVIQHISGGGGGSTVSGVSTVVGRSGDVTKAQIATALAAATRSNNPNLTTGETTANRYYGVESRADGTLFVNVPWSSGSGGSTVSVAQGDVTDATNGTLVGRITVDGTATPLYAPKVSVSQILDSGVSIATIKIGSANAITLYAPDGGSGTSGVASVAGYTGTVTTQQIATALTNAGYKLTDTVPDLSGYVTTNGLNSVLGGYVSNQALTNTLSSYATTASLGSYLPLSAGSGKALTGTLYASTMRPSTNSTSQSTGYDLGASNAFWKNTYTRRVYLYDGIYVYYDTTNKCIRTNAPIVSDSYISAGGVSTT